MLSASKVFNAKCGSVNESAVNPQYLKTSGDRRDDNDTDTNSFPTTNHIKDQ
jgi:hypothetical protein